MEITACAIEKKEEAYKQLDIMYQKALETMDKYGESLSSDYEGKNISEPAPSEVLRRAQKDWIKFRDSNCNAESYLSKGATMYDLILYNCLATMTLNRIEELQRNYIP